MFLFGHGVRWYFANAYGKVIPMAETNEATGIQETEPIEYHANDDFCCGFTIGLITCIVILVIYKTFCSD